ncbi:hypothetical protein M407DRAFT_23500 [Tulasnella calospora MUT 4182]|uniref:Uncharacterized protein n=1 Tax=Tulasnella calospora MUT 4182 TaxID=1051891 RepID=A0A0C3M119_9AGAM|nr:hypothetical protein M407DRAFT_23500 [Tulasnella calospora MUT 4182]
MTSRTPCRSTWDESLLDQQLQPALSNFRRASDVLSAQYGSLVGWWGKFNPLNDSTENAHDSTGSHNSVAQTELRNTPFTSTPGMLGKDLRSTTHRDEAGKAELLACLILSSSTSPCPGIVDFALLRIIP